VRASLRAALVPALASLALAAGVARAERGAPAVVAFRDEGGRVSMTVRGGSSATIELASPTLAVVHVAGAKAPRRIDRLPIDATAFRGPVARVEVKPTAAGLDLRVHVTKGATVSSRAAEGAVVIEVGRAEAPASSDAPGE